MKRIIKREGLPKVVQVVAPRTDEAGRRDISLVSLAGAFGRRRLVRRALRATKSKDPGNEAA